MNLVIAIVLAAVGPPTTPKPVQLVQVTGVVLDASGEPLADTPVALWTPASDEFDVFAAPFPGDRIRTDGRGRFALRAAPGHAAVVALRAGPNVVLRVTPVEIGPAGARVIVRFDGGASVRGRAVDEEGHPLAGVRVTVIPERTGAAATRGNASIARGWTTDDGEFLLAGLSEGPHRLLARAPGHRCVKACGYSAGMRIEPGSSPVTVPLERVASIRGRVVTRVRGALQPLRRFVVASIAFGNVGVDDEHGEFDIDLPRLWVGAPVYVIAEALAPYAVKVDAPTPVAIDLGSIELDRGRAVRGRIRDESGAPVPGATIRSGFAAWPLPRPSAVTAADGSFELDGVAASEAPLTVSHPRFRAVDALAPAGGGEVAIRLSSGVRLPVRVEEQDGSYVPGALVWTIMQHGPRCTTGLLGTCSLNGLEPRPEEIVEVRTQDSPRPSPQQIRVPLSGPAPPMLILRIPRQPSVLRVSVVNGAGRSPGGSVVVLPGEVTASQVMDEAGGVMLPHFVGGYGPGGRFQNLAPGTYTILWRGADGHCFTQGLTLEAGGEREIVVKLPDEPPSCGHARQ